MPLALEIQNLVDLLLPIKRGRLIRIKKNIVIMGFAGSTAGHDLERTIS